MTELTIETDHILDDGAIPICEAVAWSGIGRTRLYLAMAEGRLPFIQSGKRRLIPRRALQRFLAEGLVDHHQNARVS